MIQCNVIARVGCFKVPLPVVYVFTCLSSFTNREYVSYQKVQGRPLLK